MGGGWRGATNASKAIMDKQSDKERERNQLSCTSTTFHAKEVRSLISFTIFNVRTVVVFVVVVLPAVTPVKTSTAAEVVAHTACGGRVLEIYWMLGAWHATPRKKTK